MDAWSNGETRGIPSGAQSIQRLCIYAPSIIGFNIACKFDVANTSQSFHTPIAACINITAYHDTNYFNPTDFRMKYSAHTAPVTPARVSTAATHSSLITGAWTAENFWRLWYYGHMLVTDKPGFIVGFRRRALIWSDMRLSCWQTSTQIYPDCAPLMVTGSGSKLPSEEYTYLVSSMSYLLSTYWPVLYILSSSYALLKVGVRCRSSLKLKSGPVVLDWRTLRKFWYLLLNDLDEYI